MFRQSLTLNNKLQRKNSAEVVEVGEAGGEVGGGAEAEAEAEASDGDMLSLMRAASKETADKKQEADEKQEDAESSSDGAQKVPGRSRTPGSMADLDPIDGFVHDQDRSVGRPSNRRLRDRICRKFPSVDPNTLEEGVATGEEGEERPLEAPSEMGTSGKIGAQEERPSERRTSAHRLSVHAGMVVPVGSVNNGLPTEIQLRTVDFYGSELRFAGVSLYDYWRDLVDHVKSFGFNYSFACLWDDANEITPPVADGYCHSHNSRVCDKLSAVYDKPPPSPACAGCAWFDKWAANVELCIADGQSLFFVYLERPLSHAQPQFNCTAAGYEGDYFVGSAQLVELEWLQNEKGATVLPIRVQDIVAPVMAIGVTKIAEEAKMLTDLAFSSGKALDVETAKLLDCYKTVLQNYSEAREVETSVLPDVLREGVMKLTAQVDVSIGLLDAQKQSINQVMGDQRMQRQLSQRLRTPHSGRSSHDITPQSSRNSSPSARQRRVSRGSPRGSPRSGGLEGSWKVDVEKARRKAKVDHDQNPHTKKGGNGDVPDLKYLINTKKQRQGDTCSPRSPLLQEQPVVEDDGFGLETHGRGGGGGKADAAGSARSKNRSVVRMAADELNDVDGPRAGTTTTGGGGGDCGSGGGGDGGSGGGGDGGSGGGGVGGVRPSGNASPLDPAFERQSAKMAALYASDASRRQSKRVTRQSSEKTMVADTDDEAAAAVSECVKVTHVLLSSSVLSLLSSSVKENLFLFSRRLLRACARRCSHRPFPPPLSPPLSSALLFLSPPPLSSSLLLSPPPHLHHLSYTQLSNFLRKTLNQKSPGPLSNESADNNAGGLVADEDVGGMLEDNVLDIASGLRAQITAMMVTVNNPPPPFGGGGEGGGSTSDAEGETDCGTEGGDGDTIDGEGERRSSDTSSHTDSVAEMKRHIHERHAEHRGRRTSKHSCRSGEWRPFYFKEIRRDEEIAGTVIWL
jgi:hypothetical protein